ncbi:MAG: hypothetical protein FJZ56_02985 [Chlamydiae bacterium]|nr:hypothetical protein [Chlamydiota bacterium]
MSIDGLNGANYQNIIGLLDQKNRIHTNSMYLKCTDIVDSLKGKSEQTTTQAQLEPDWVELIDPDGGVFRKIEEIVALSFKEESLTIQQKFKISEKAKSLFARYNRKLEINDSSITICLVDHEGTKKNVQFSINQISSIPFFKTLLCGNFKESNQAGEIEVTLPYPNKAEDLLNLLNFTSLTKSDELIPALFLCGYFETKEYMSKCIQHACQHLSSEEIYLIILNMPELQDEDLSILVSAYIKKALAEGLPIADIISAIQAQEEIEILPDNAGEVASKKLISPFLDRISHVSLDLNLSEATITPEILQNLETALPNVRSLNLRKASILELPAVWQEQLESLDISETKISTISHHYTNLKEFSAILTNHLSNLEGLNQSKHLKKIDISFSKVTTLPQGCDALEKLDAYFAENLRDISPIDRLKNLKQLNIGTTSIDRAPIECDALEVFEANYNHALVDISGLNNLSNLRILNLSNTHIAEAPTDCTHLEKFIANDAKNLINLRALNDLKYLKTIEITNTRVSAAPSGCENLQHFIAPFNNLLEDLSGLNHAASLKHIDVSGSKVKVAPLGCQNLEVFKANYAQELEDINGLNSLEKLTRLELVFTNIQKAPVKCPNLEIFEARTTESLKDISGLDGLAKLQKLSLAGTSIERAPIGCLNLEEFDAFGVESLEDVSGLNDLTQLIKIDISNTNVKTAPSGCINLEQLIANEARQLSDIEGLNNLKKLTKLSLADTLAKTPPTGCDVLKDIMLPLEFYFDF